MSGRPKRLLSARTTASGRALQRHRRRRDRPGVLSGSKAGQDEQFAAGTGFLVSPCHVLTAYHVAAGGERVDPTRPSTFYVGQGKIGPDFPDLDRFAESSLAHPVAWGRFVHAEQRQHLLERTQSVERNGWEDWALLELDTCFGATPITATATSSWRRSPRARSCKAATRIKARSVGLPGDKSVLSLWEDADCRLIGQIYASGWQHDCITIPGNSGGPIFVTDPADDGTARRRHFRLGHRGRRAGDGDVLRCPGAAKDDPNFYDYLAVAVPVSGFIDRIARTCRPTTRVADFVARYKHDDPYDTAHAGMLSAPSPI